MTVDYDVVIIGGTPTGRYAALMATQLQAKVALVEPKPCYDFIPHYVFNEIGQLAPQLHCDHQYEIKALPFQTQQKYQIPFPWLQEGMLYAQSVAFHLEQLYSPAILSAQGIDVILGQGQFQSSPYLAFVVGDRLLRGRRYLLASGSIPAIPEIEGLQKTGFLTISNIWQSLNERTPPNNWVVLGGVPQSVEIAQTLARLGYSVTLIVNSPLIIRHADPEVAQLLQAQLEAEGVRVLTKTPVTQVRLLENKKWLQAGDKAIETDEIVVAIAQQPNIEFLNLAAVGVKWRHRHLVVNERLQTTNRRIYACGDVIGGYDCAHIANYEARIALKNALFFPRHKVNYRFIPWGINSAPMFAQVGLTEAQAKQQYHPDGILVLRQYFQTLVAAHLQEEITGMCKLIVRQNGEILGASILGAQARELINVITLAMTKKIKIHQVANLSAIFPSFSEILEQTAAEWKKQKLQSNIFQQECLQGFFYCRRRWNL